MGDGNSIKVLKEQIVHRQMLIFPAIILKVVNHYLVLLASALASTSRNWPRLRSRNSGLGLEVLASFNITGYNVKISTENCLSNIHTPQ